VCLALKSPAAMNYSAEFINVSRSEISIRTFGGLYFKLIATSVFNILILINVDWSLVLRDL
jgi:hypothetical protein